MVALAAGLVARSVALIGFGVDSVVEVGASVVAQGRLRAVEQRGLTQAAARYGRFLGVPLSLSVA